MTVSTLPAIRTTEGLRDVLFDEIDALRDGSGDRRRALAVAELARQIVKTAWLDLDTAKKMADGSIVNRPATKLGRLVI